MIWYHVIEPSDHLVISLHITNPVHCTLYDKSSSSQRGNIITTRITSPWYVPEYINYTLKFVAVRSWIYFSRMLHCRGSVGKMMMTETSEVSGAGNGWIILPRYVRMFLGSQWHGLIASAFSFGDKIRKGVTWLWIGPNQSNQSNQKWMAWLVRSLFEYWICMLWNRTNIYLNRNCRVYLV